MSTDRMYCLLFMAKYSQGGGGAQPPQKRWKQEYRIGVLLTKHAVNFLRGNRWRLALESTSAGLMLPLEITTEVLT